MQTLLLLQTVMFLKVQGIVMMLLMEILMFAMLQRILMMWLMEFLMVLTMLVMKILKFQWILNALHGMRKKRSIMRK